MMNSIYIIRHCSAEGRAPAAPLMEEGFKQAKQLSNFFKKREGNRIISSPFFGKSIDCTGCQAKIY
ncbi:histidine phosphatase family protein [Virgibacillus sp. YIM 98842]|jgi:2,3-bisphosphoglycerate-dependent phosphoglycerate mutase|uniref:histidine phosphatase family protein n=1 Tax=Virgibacillus sp. YIM 98842 TaxID=2663533 RepID=UPI0013DBB05A|nr:histidine phosphatase family protein [Virgibacillus sp. YIM 98842]